MKITWLGQAGLLFETDQVTIMVDPYFSDSCEKRNKRLKRRVQVKEEFLHKSPNVLLLTHNHLDHTDPETLSFYLRQDTEVCVISSKAAHELVLTYPGNHNCIIFEPGTQWTIGDIRLTAVKAFHSEESAFGVILEQDGKKYYVTGDTLYNTHILEELPKDIFAVFLPVNGRGNNMNIQDASEFARDCNAKWAVPLHWGMFDDIVPLEFEHSGRIIPKLYEKIDFEEEAER
ncbi:MAG TPA: MBL fold metallo-hydrolase [Candidatus Eisenbergiella merdipullorum]|uniref:MBL fold metallo-hydrolase n=1 Tax=Candidatus Eisenbergiella merdipullorum TaxID=2838553 RepID=A0A9D2L260_9FIRM|nr:MBL fold metallo-hydrolase [Candidatus Eisenbergiella merdipullorum]